NLAEKCPGVWGAEVQPAHVRHIKNASRVACLVVLINDAAIHQRHLPACEIHQLGAGGYMEVVKGCAHQGHEGAEGMNGRSEMQAATGRASAAQGGYALAA